MRRLHSSYVLAVDAQDSKFWEHPFIPVSHLRIPYRRRRTESRYVAGVVPLAQASFFRTHDRARRGATL